MPANMILNPYGTSTESTETSTIPNASGTYTAHMAASTVHTVRLAPQPHILRFLWTKAEDSMGISRPTSTRRTERTMAS